MYENDLILQVISSQGNVAIGQAQVNLLECFSNSEQSNDYELELKSNDKIAGRIFFEVKWIIEN